MAKQEWFCEICDQKGEITYSDEEDDVFSVINKIADDHDDKSPKCLNLIEKIRVVNQDFQLH